MVIAVGCNIIEFEAGVDEGSRVVDVLALLGLPPTGPKMTVPLLSGVSDVDAKGWDVDTAGGTEREVAGESLGLELWPSPKVPTGPTRTLPESVELNMILELDEEIAPEPATKFVLL